MGTGASFHKEGIAQKSNPLTTTNGEELAPDYALLHNYEQIDVKSIISCD